MKLIAVNLKSFYPKVIISNKSLQKKKEDLSNPKSRQFSLKSLTYV